MERPRTAPIRTLVAATLLAAAAVTGCSNTSTSPNASTSDLQSAAPVPTPQAASITGLRLPISRYMPSADELALSRRLRTLLVRDCLRRYDAELSDAFGKVMQTRQVSIDPLNMARRYGLGRIDDARRYGYRPPPARGSEEGTQRDPAALFRAYSPEQRILLAGAPGRKRGAGGSSGSISYRGQSIPRGGCYGEADRRLANSGSMASAAGGVVSTIESRALNQAREDPRVIEATVRWSSCMKKQGYQYRDPYEAAGDTARWRPETRPRASSDEISTALADMRCKEKTNLLGVWFAVESQYENGLIRQHASELAAVKRQLSAEAEIRQKLSDKYKIS
ncbi:hypothetical protein ACIP3A_14700 [Streptomyces tricolor]|uniref:hypothetical protein n=1 Tax=Streptomyces tricolor TaxID=68277 RepID=UPI003820EBB5